VVISDGKACGAGHLRWKAAVDPGTGQMTITGISGIAARGISGRCCSTRQAGGVLAPFADGQPRSRPRGLPRPGPRGLPPAGRTAWNLRSYVVRPTRSRSAAPPGLPRPTARPAS
jgi:hypothetical protein